MLVFWWENQLSSLPILRLHLSQICISKFVELIMWCHVIQEYIPCRMEIPIDFERTKAGTIHGLAFWFEAAFIGTRYVISMVCVSLTMSLLPYCFVKCHSMAIYCSTPANHSLASGMQQLGPSFAQPLIVIIGGYELGAFVYDKWLYREVYNQ